MTDAMSRGRGVKSIHTFFDAIEYSNVQADVDLTNAGPYTDQPARGFLVLAAGASDTIVVVTDSGEERTYRADLLVGIHYIIGLRTLKAATADTVRVIIGW